MPHRLPFAAVIFDMDGLLLDTERIALAAFNDVCSRFGIGEQTDVFMRCVGTNAAAGQQVIKDGLGGLVDDVAFGRAWHERFAARTTDAPVPLKAGALELITALAGMNVPLAVATSTHTTRARQQLAATGLLASFSAVVGGDQVSHSKPHPAIYLRAAEVLRVEPSSCLALEDSENGVRAAVAAGMIVVQVPDLIQPSPELRALGHRVEASLWDVLKVVLPADASVHDDPRLSPHRV